MSKGITFEGKNFKIPSDLDHIGLFTPVAADIYVQ